YIYSRILIYNYIVSLNFTYTLLRVREYFKFRARRNSSRGLLYKISDIIFIVFKNKEGIVELTIYTIRDMKGITHTLYKRPKYTLYENIEPLYTNPIIPILAITIVDKAF
ncbi:hypothetical protein F5882DRAFT_305767, partial [Hyaloscypha sp. PMI_1271]